MRYFLSKDKKPKLILKANDTDLMERWILHNAGYFMEKDAGNSVKAFVSTKSGDAKLQKTSLALCEDDILLRTVLAKTVVYDKRELDDVEAIKIRRRALAAQVDILNNVASNMLPEPLDFFLVTNTEDSFVGEAKQLKDNEPVLILDYIPGDVLADKLRSTWDKTFYRSEEGKNEVKKSPENINVGMVMRLVGDILAFELELYEKGYAYTSLSPDHIVLLGDNKPRFLGLGRICPVTNDKYDVNHINFGRQLQGYGAPEFNKAETQFGMNESVKAAIAFNLGVIIASVMLGKADFNENELSYGAYDYFNATEDRKKICEAWHGRMVDSLICRLTNPEPEKRITNFSVILNELSVITGDASNERKKETIYYGNVKFFARDKGFGFVSSGGIDYFVPLSRLDDTPTGYDGQDVTFTIEKDRNGKDVVKAFVKPPRTDYVFPRLVSKPKPVVQPIPQPTPKPQPKPTPQPKPKPQPKTPPQTTPKPVPMPQPTPTPQNQPKKGFFARLFGL